METYIKPFQELTTDELYEIVKLRSAVFVVEQNCVYQDCDDKDQSTCHIWIAEDEQIAAYLRVLPEDGEGVAVIGRVLAVKRRCGIGTRILQEGIRFVREHTDASEIQIHAQTYARGLYEKQGFEQYGDEFLEDGIPHIPMRLILRKAQCTRR